LRIEHSLSEAVMGDRLSGARIGTMVDPGTVYSLVDRP